MSTDRGWKTDVGGKKNVSSSLKKPLSCEFTRDTTLSAIRKSAACFRALLGTYPGKFYTAS